MFNSVTVRLIMQIYYKTFLYLFLPHLMLYHLLIGICCSVVMCHELEVAVRVAGHCAIFIAWGVMFRGRRARFGCFSSSGHSGKTDRQTDRVVGGFRAGVAHGSGGWLWQVAILSGLSLTSKITPERRKWEFPASLFHTALFCLSSGLVMLPQSLLSLYLLYIHTSILVLANIVLIAYNCYH